MSDEPAYVLWALTAAVGLFGLAVIGYVMGPVPPPQQPQQRKGGFGGLMGPGPGAGRGQQPPQSPFDDPGFRRPEIKKATPVAAKSVAAKPVTAKEDKPLTAAGTVAISDDNGLLDFSDEDLLLQKVETLHALLSAGKIDEAFSKCDSLIAEHERIYGVNSDESIDFAFRLSHYFKDPSFIRRAFDSLSSTTLDASERLKYFIGIAVQLTQMYESKTDIGGILSVNEAVANADVDPSLEKFFLIHFLRSARYCFSIYRQLGKWIATEKLVQSSKDRFNKYPLECIAIIEQHVTSLHQEGKTRDAIDILKEYHAKIQDLEESKTAIGWCLARLAKLLFYLDRYEESRDYLIQVVDNCEPDEILKEYLIDLLSVYVELGDLEKATEVFEKIKSDSSSDDTILARSKYLLTCATHLNNSHYDIDLKVCRAPPQRLEGETEEAESDFKRKLDNFFLEVTFEHPDFTEPVIHEQAVDHFDINIKHSVPETLSEEWHLVKMVIYEDSSKEKILGRHWQPVFKRII